jgi:glycolate oxidase
VNDACRGVTEILARGILPAAVEMIDQKTLRAVEQYIKAGLPTDAAALLLVEVDGLVDDLTQQADRAMEACKAAKARDVRLAKDEAERAKLWKGRKQAFGALGRIAPNYYTHDGVIPRTKLPEVLDEIGRISERNRVIIANVFHAGDGNLHPVVLYDEREEGVIERVRKASDEILSLVAKVGGGLSGEHGIGLEKLSHMKDFFSEADLLEMNRIRDVFNPKGLCNPGKAIPSAGACGPAGRNKLPIGH